MVFAVVLICLLAAVFSTSWYQFQDKCQGIFIFSMLFLGPWQLLSGFLSMLFYHNKQKAYYFFGVLLYLCTLGFCKMFPQWLFPIYFLGGSWSFATWYLWMTWQKIAESEENSAMGQ